MKTKNGKNFTKSNVCCFFELNGVLYMEIFCFFQKVPKSAFFREIVPKLVTFHIILREKQQEKTSFSEIRILNDGIYQ